MNKITRILTIRHGQTVYNLEKRYAGSIDIPLNEKGIEVNERGRIPDQADISNIPPVRWNCLGRWARRGRARTSGA